MGYIMSEMYVRLLEEGYIFPKPQPAPEPIPDEKIVSIGNIMFRFGNADTDPSTLTDAGTWTRVTGSAYNDWCYTDSVKYQKFVILAHDAVVHALSYHTNEHTVTRNGNNLILDYFAQNIDEEPPEEEIANFANTYLITDTSTGTTYKPTYTASSNYDADTKIWHITVYYVYPEVLVLATGSQPSLTNKLTSSFDSDIKIIGEHYTFMYATSLHGCTGITEIADNSFNAIINAQGMFAGCTGLTRIPEGSFRSVTLARDMFSNCTGLTSLPESGFNSVKDTSYMFEGCTSIKSAAIPYLKDWTERSCTYTRAFSGDTLLSDYEEAKAAYPTAFT